MVVVLDEAANVCRIGDLPELYSHLGSRGIVPLTILQSYSQGARVWGEEGMRTLWSAATVKLIGSGIDDARFAEDLSRLVGDHDVPHLLAQLAAPAGRSTNVSSRQQRILAARPDPDPAEGDGPRAGHRRSSRAGGHPSLVRRDRAAEIAGRRRHARPTPCPPRRPEALMPESDRHRTPRAGARARPGGGAGRSSGDCRSSYWNRPAGSRSRRAEVRAVLPLRAGVGAGPLRAGVRAQPGDPGQSRGAASGGSTPRRRPAQSTCGRCGS